MRFNHSKNSGVMFSYCYDDDYIGYGSCNIGSAVDGVAQRLGDDVRSPGAPVRV